jgi:hypothetical protein
MPSRNKGAPKDCSQLIEKREIRRIQVESLNLVTISEFLNAISHIAVVLLRRQAAMPTHAHIGVENLGAYLRCDKFWLI